MGFVKSMADEMMREIGNKSREFYEFVLPPVDMRVGDGRLTVTIDLPGFAKKDIRLRLDANILSVNAEKPGLEKEGEGGSVVCNQRPGIIDKRIRLPVNIRRGKETVESARFADGVLTVVIPFSRSGRDITIE